MKDLEVNILSSGRVMFYVTIGECIYICVEWRENLFVVSETLPRGNDP